MPELRKTEIEYDPPPKTHFLARLAFVLIAVLIVVAIVALVKDKKGERKAAITGIAKDRPPAEVPTGKPLQTRFFEITIDTAEALDSLSYTYNRGIIKSSADPGNQYLVLYMTLRNTDTESKMMPDGQLTIEDGNSELKYDSPEIFSSEGWGVLMVNIDPGILKKTRIVYKIPDNINGKAYYYPDVSYNKDRIFLANLGKAAQKATEDTGAAK